MSEIACLTGSLVRCVVAVGIVMSVTINCPECGAGLKLPDRSFLGRKGKCPKCRHRFVLEEPDEVELELAEPAPPPVAPAAPMVGTSPRWVPDEPQSSEPVFSSADQPPAASAQPADVANQFDFNATTAAPGPTPSTPITGVGEPPASGGTDAEQSVMSRTRRKRKSRTGPVIVGVGTALFVFCMIGVWWQQSSQARLDQEREAAARKPKTNEAWENQQQNNADSNEAAKELSPTNGAPIPMDYMPFTPHLVFHIRPAEIWARERDKQEFLATTGELGTWLQAKIAEVTRFEPEEIEELTFAINFGARTAEPDVAAVVRLKAEQSTSDIQLKRFRGQVRPDLPVKIFESDPYSYMLLDPKTFAVAPVTMSDSLADAKTFSRQPSVDLEVLVKESDRRRQVTLMFDVTNLDTHREYIFGTDMQTLADEFVLWFGTDIQTVSWSLHLDGEKMYMETLLHNSAESSPLRVQRHIRGRLKDLPQQMMDVVRMMKPGTMGRRDMIGRFPLMLKATALGTSNHVGPQYVRLVTLLPAKAAPNLAAASLFSWDQSLVTDFTGPAPVVAGSKPKMPAKIIDRLKQVNVYVDFSGTPLQEALQYVGEEIQTTIEIDGDGLKQVALTQNMRQNHKVGEVPAMKAFDLIITNPDYRNMMVMVVDESAKKILVTSRPAAEAAGLPIFDTKQ